MDEAVPEVSLKHLISSCITGRKDIRESYDPITLGDAVCETGRFLCLASSHKDVVKVLRWLDDLYSGRDKYSSALIQELLKQDVKSSRSSRIVLTALLELKAFESNLIDASKLESLFDLLDFDDFTKLPIMTLTVNISGPSTLGKLKLAAFSKAQLAAEFIATMLTEFKGTGEELLSLLEYAALCIFDRADSKLKAVVERMLLRNSANACLVIQMLNLMDLVRSAFLPLLVSETDAVRDAALKTLLSHGVDSDAEAWLLSAFNSKGLAVKCKITLASALAKGPHSAQARELALSIVCKENNELLVASLLPIVQNDPQAFAQLKTGKLGMRAVLARGMGASVKQLLLPQLQDALVKESAPSSSEAVNFACAALNQLSGICLPQFIADADAKPTSLLRAAIGYGLEAQSDLIAWLVAYPTPEPAVARCLTNLAINGPAEVRRHLFSSLKRAETHTLHLSTLAGGLDGSLNSWKLCKAIAKSESDLVGLFDACHRLGHDWLSLATRISPNLPAFFDAHFGQVFDAESSSSAALTTLSQFAAERLRGAIRAYIDDTITTRNGEEELIWAHADELTPARPLPPRPAGTAKADHKVERALLEEHLAHEKSVRQRIRQSIARIERAAILAHYTEAEGFGWRIADLLQSPVYREAASHLLYAIARDWRPLVVSALIRRRLGEGASSAVIDSDWNMSSRDALEASILRLFVERRPMETATSFVIPLLGLLIAENDQVAPMLAERLEDLMVIGEIPTILASRFLLLEPLLTSERPVLESRRILSSLGDGSLHPGPEAEAFVAALNSEIQVRRRTALIALHAPTWALGTSLTPEVVKKILLTVELLSYDEGCMQEATAVALKLRDHADALAVDQAERMAALCSLLTEEKCEESWILEAAKEAIATIDAATAVAVLLEHYERLLHERRPEIVNVRSRDLDLTRRGRAALVDALGMLTIHSECTDDAGRREAALQTALEALLSTVFYDPASECFELGLQSALALLDGIPAERMERLGPILGRLFESHVSGTPASNALIAEASVETKDRARVFSVILLGRVSRWLAQDAEHRRTLLNTLKRTLLETPAENVQAAVAEALVPLFSPPSYHTEAAAMAQSMLTDTLLHPSSKMGARRGAAYGLGALAQARGLRSLREWGLMEALLKPLEQQTHGQHEIREGALFGLELLARFLGHALEPYVLHTIDGLLAGFADGKAEVRQATLDATRSLMGCVSSAGARLLLPALLQRATRDDASWRSRAGVLEWLGAMASLAPSVLAARLPDIIPVLIETGLNDSHGQVQTTARRALVEYGKAVANPEMRGLIPSIMEALADPANGTAPCFRRILDTQFAHVIDGPSLALLEPLLRRALTDRSSNGATLKRLAGQIIGNLATSLVDAAAFGPYLCTLVPALCGCLGDPVPQVRAHAAKVLGMLVRVAELDGRSTSLAAVGHLFPDLEAALLAPPTNEIDRAGAAQALAEIMAARGPAFTSEVLKRAPGWLEASEPVERQAALLLLAYLPGAFDFYDRLEELYTETGLRDLIPAVLGASADPVEAVRTGAGKTSRALIEALVAAGIDLPGLFGALLDGLGAARWRIRLACLGMLEKALTISSSGAEQESDLEPVSRLPTAAELAETGVVDEAAVRLLLARLYLARYDPASSQLRTTGLTLWKALAPHSPRTLTEILPVLVAEAARISGDASEALCPALEDLFVRIGDRLAVPFLAQSVALLTSADVIDGSACTILHNMIVCVRVLGAQPDILTKNLFDEAQRHLITAVAHGLAMDSKEEREAAAELCDALLRSLPGLSTPEQAALLLRQIINTPGVDQEAVTLLLLERQAAAILALVIPEALTGLPDNSKLERLATVFDAAGSAAIPHAIPVLKSLLAAYSEPSELLDDALQAAMSCLNDPEDGDEDDSDDDWADEQRNAQDSVFHLRLWQLMEAQMEAQRETWAFRLVRLYCQATPDLDHGRLYSAWLPRLLTATFAPGTPSDVADTASAALLALLSAVPGTQLPALIQLTRTPVSRLPGHTALSPTRHTPVLTLLVKGVLLPSLTGTPGLAAHEAEVVRVHACEVTTGLLRVSTGSPVTASWGSSSLTLLIGALIRVAAEQRKARESRPAALGALYEALRAHAVALKPFFPQLQRLFAQAVTASSSDDLAEDAEAARLASNALVLLAPMLGKPEALIQDWAAILALPALDDQDDASDIEDEDDGPTNIQRVTIHAKAMMLRCLATMLKQSPSELGPKLVDLRAPFNDLLRLSAAHGNESVRLANAELIDALATAQVLSDSERDQLRQLSFLLK